MVRLSPDGSCRPYLIMVSFTTGAAGLRLGNNVFQGIARRSMEGNANVTEGHLISIPDLERKPANFATSLNVRNGCGCGRS